MQSLRRGLQIISHEPVLFTGSFRSNIDVETEFEDKDIWQVLEMVGLQPYVSAQNLKLDAPITENGENLSVGQRQLLCLARSILKRPIILVMDEATASVDAQADALIQKSIKMYFEKATVISIAHRLNTIVDFDRVVVLDKGKMVECDSPASLLSNPESLFYKLGKATGEANFKLLKELAKNN